MLLSRLSPSVRFSLFTASLAAALALGAGCSDDDVKPAASDGGARDQAAVNADGAALADGGGSAQLPEGFVAIQPGTFQMGSPAGEPCRDEDNELQHRVTLTRRFALQAKEVTQKQFETLMGYNPSRFVGCGENCPVDSVNWHEAAAYANAMSKKANLAACYDCMNEGRDVYCEAVSGYACGGYRLPLEAEWEYAYRAGTTTALYNGAVTECKDVDAKAEAVAWYQDNSDVTYAECVAIPGGRCIGTHPVGQKAPNAWGLYDMAGNVWEWCHDTYRIFGADAVTDPSETDSGGQNLRGGGFKAWAEYLRAANRYSTSSKEESYKNGFRLALTL